MADILTFEERRAALKGRRLHGWAITNNVLTSWVHAAKAFNLTLKIATPKELAPDSKLKDWIKKSGAEIEVLHDPEKAVKGARCGLTDTWVSMGDRDAEHRHQLLKPFKSTPR